MIKHLNYKDIAKMQDIFQVYIKNAFILIGVIFDPTHGRV